MNPNVRLVLMIIGFVLLGAAIYWVLGPEAEPDAPVSEVEVPGPAEDDPAQIRLEMGRAEVVETPPPANPAPPEPMEGETITGMVVVDGQGVPDASVAAYQANIGAVRTTTDAQGAFVIGGLTLQSYRVSATKEGFNEAVQPEVPAGTDNVVLELAPLSSVAGRVVDIATSAPLANAEIAYLEYPPGGDEHWRRMVAEGRPNWVSGVDADGQFTFDGIASNKEVAIAARAPGYAPAYVLVGPVMSGDSANVELRLAAGARITGTVTGPEGEAIADASIHLMTDDDVGPSLATTDGQGEFILSDIGDGLVTLVARRDGYIDGGADVEVRPGQVATADIEMGQGGLVTGVVYRGTTPVAGQQVMIGQMQRNGFSKRTETGPDGVYEIDGVPAGVLYVMAVLELEGEGPGANEHRMQRNAVVEAGQVTQVDFQFPEAFAAIEGMVTINGQAPSNLEVRGMTTTDTGDAPLSAQVTPEGAYRAENVMPGEILLDVQAELATGEERRRRFQLSVAPGEVLRHDVAFDESAAISGRITNAEAGRGAQVMVVPGSLDADLSTFEGITQLERQQVAQAVLDEAGNFHVGGLSAGLYTVVAIEFPADGEDGGDFLGSLRIATQEVELPATGAVEVQMGF